MGYVGTKPTDAPLTTSQLEDGLVTAPKLATDAVETAKVKDINITTGKITDLNVTNAKLGTDISAVKLTAGTIPDARFPAILPAVSGANLTGITTYTDSLPTIASISPSVIENTSTAVTITGTNFVSIPFVDAINSSTGAIVTADSVAFTGSTEIVATFTLPIDGTYYIRAENNDGLSVRSTTALLTVSDVPAWVTGSGSLGSFSGGSSIGTLSLVATNSTGMTLQSGALPGGISLNTGVGTSTLTGTESGASTDTTYSFTIRATDAEAQTADRAFTITITFDANNSCQFN